MIRKFYRLNQYIKAEKVRVVDEGGTQLGIFPLTEALEKARKAGKDLVEVSPNADPPVCKIIDFKKFKYLEQKKHQEEKRKNKRNEIKEIRFTPFIAQNDFNFRIKRAEEFLKEGAKVKITVLFKGRQMTKKDFGYKILERTKEALKEYAKIEGEPKFINTRLEMLLSPIKNFQK